MDSAALVSIARNQVNLGHIASESDSKSTTLVQFSSDKVFSCTCNLLTTRTAL